MQQLFNKCIKLFLAFSLLYISFSSGFAQIKIIKEQHTIEPRPGEIPIKIINNTILIPVDLNYKLRLYFILDTGVSTTIITEPLVSDLLGLKYERDIKIRGYGIDEPLEAFVASNFNYQFNEFFQFKNRDVIVLKESVNLDYYFGVPVYGLIGYDFLKDYEVSIDYQRSKLYIKEPLTQKRIGKLKRKKNIKVYDLFMDGTKPYIFTEIEHDGLKDSVKLLIDTGFSGALTLFPSEKADAYLTEPYILNYQGYGLNGQILSTFKKIDQINVSKNMTLNKVATNFIDTIALQNISHHKTSDGSIGNSVLSRFKVTIDYHNEKLILKKAKVGFRDPFYYNYFGARVLIKETQNEGWEYFIQSVRKGSEAQLAGLNANDQLVAINGKTIRNMDITRVYELLNDFTTTHRNIVVKRNQDELVFDFNLDPIIEWN